MAKNVSKMQPGDWQLSGYGLIVKGRDLVTVKKEITKNKPSLMQGLAEKLKQALEAN